ncbi:hypothetical protein D9619_002023 [Psilocybe cf. subviscida]|uniref:Uncharacterized protein n=1 Tax=Psilocybe cf. subviscida TaxID=2480587 RepID=A0A8H5F2W7_9AGAR|nr:hypothetical protein D9619_002023 [Psilocybe cf. subviscida]
MPFATAPALLIGLGARILLDTFSRTEPPATKDFILVGAWQGVALHYATKSSANSTYGVLVGIAIAAKLFVEFNLVFDVARCVTTVLGIALGALFTDFLSQYFEKSPLISALPDRSSSTRRRRSTATAPRTTPTRPEQRRQHERTVQFRPSVQGGSVETLTAELTDVTGNTTASRLFSDITSVDSLSDKFGPNASMTELEREAHILRTRASLADTERRRLREERKWAASQGNEARAQQMKWEVKRYTALMQTFLAEAETKSQEASRQNASTSGTPRRIDPAAPVKPVTQLPSPSTPTPQKPSRNIVNGRNSPQPLPVPPPSIKPRGGLVANYGKTRDTNG